MPSSHLILCHPLLLLPPIPPSIRVFSNESTLHMSWPKNWSFSFSISPSNEHPGLISFRMDGWISLQSKGLSRVFSNTTVQKHHSLALSFFHSPTFTSIHDHWKTIALVDQPNPGHHHLFHLNTLSSEAPLLHFAPSAQFSSVAQSCLTLCYPMNHSTPGLPVHHQLPEFTQTHVH